MRAFGTNISNNSNKKPLVQNNRWERSPPRTRKTTRVINNENIPTLENKTLPYRKTYHGASVKQEIDKKLTLIEPALLNKEFIKLGNISNIESLANYLQYFGENLPEVYIHVYKSGSKLGGGIRLKFLDNSRLEYDIIPGKKIEKYSLNLVSSNIFSKSRKGLIKRIKRYEGNGIYKDAYETLSPLVSNNILYNLIGELKRILLLSNVGLKGGRKTRRRKTRKKRKKTRRKRQKKRRRRSKKNV
jgi:hypothetical protein